MGFVDFLKRIFKPSAKKQIAVPKKIYCIPGFGTDDKIFANLKVDNAELQYINWIDPLPKESFHAYVERMMDGMDEDAIIIGVSFGGMVALEIAKIIPVKQIILISSVKTRKELPGYLRITGNLRLNRIFPLIRVYESERYYDMANRRVGAYTKEEKEFANAYRKNAKLNYINWGFNQILNWKNDAIPDNIVHIHGDSDLIFPLRYVTPTHLIRGGTHMMVMNRTDEINTIINHVLAKL